MMNLRRAYISVKFGDPRLPDVPQGCQVVETIPPSGPIRDFWLVISSPYLPEGIEGSGIPEFDSYLQSIVEAGVRRAERRKNRMIPIYQKPSGVIGWRKRA